MKKTFFKSILCASLFVGAFTSCNEVEDLYNPELVRERAQEAFGLPVDPNHTWSMTSVITANITLNEDALSDYSFRIYSANPLDENSGAVILAEHPVKTDAQGKASASFQFEMPSYLNYVYVARVDNHGRRMIGLSKIQNGAISKAFGESNSTSTKAITDYAFPTITSPYTQDEVNAVLPDAYDLTQGLTNAQGFAGMAGETGKTVAKIVGKDVVCDYINGFQNHNDNTLIIADGATWKLPAGQLRIDGTDIIIANGGKLEFTGKLELANGARLIVMKGGVVDNTTSTASDENINISAGCLIYNAGDLNVKKIYSDNGACLQNDETGVWKTNTTKCAGGAGWENFINWGRIESDEIISNGNQGTLYNACLVRANTLTLDKLSLKDNSAIEVPEIHCNAMYLRENSIIRTTTLKTNQNIVIDYIGAESGKALVSATTFNLGNTPAYIEYSNIYIELKNILQSGNYNPWMIEQFYNKVPEANTFGIGEAPLVIITDQTDVKDPSIETATCAGKGNKPTNYVPREEPAVFTYAFEDTDKGAGDYDFNDVVIKCSAPINNEIVVTLVAVGAQKRINLMYDNPLTGQIENIFGEVHAAFENGATENFINTLVGNHPFECPSVEIEVPEGFTYKNNGDFFINVVNSSATSHLPQFTDNYEEIGVPYAILVPVDWRYPQEWQRVDNAYANFANWAENALEDIDWYTTEINESKVY